LTARTTGRRIAVVAVVAVAVLFLSLLQTDRVQSVLRGVGLAAQPDEYLEVYFTNPLALPDKAYSGRTVPISFDLAARGRDYHVNWTIESGGLGHREADATGTTLVPAGTTTTIERDVTLSCAGATPGEPRTRITIRVDHDGEPAHQVITAFADCPEVKT
jgi:hypothetical protein